MPNSKLLLIDTFALAHRAFHAFPDSLSTKRGEKTNAIYGFSSMLLQVLKQFKPEYIICALDSKGPTVRHEMFSKYKANRPKMDEDLATQIPKIESLIKTLNIPAISLNGYEADDIIGSTVKDPQYLDYDKIIVTGDRDLLQLVDDKTSVFLAGGAFSASKLYTHENVDGKFGVSSGEIVDYKALRGDPSDNIPGVPGVGEKTATDLINEYHTLENIYENLDKIKPAIVKKLESGRDLAFVSRKLAQIITDLHVKLDLSASEYQDINFDEGKKLFEYYEFRSLVEKLSRLDPRAQKTELQNNNNGTEYKIEYKTINVSNIDLLEKMIEDLLVRDWFVSDFVLDGNFFSKPLTVQFSIENVVFVVPSTLLEKEKTLFNKILNSKKLIVYDAKKYSHMLKTLEYENFEFADDLMLMDYLLLGGNVKVNLQSSVLRYLNIKNERAEQAGLFEESNGCAQSYQVMLLSKAINKDFEKRLQNDKLPNIGSLYREIELPLVKVLVDIERNGIKLDPEVLRVFDNDLTEKISILEKQIFDLSGESFNISSPKQMSHILFEKLKIPGSKKNKSGGYSTNERILNNYVNEYPIIAKILEYRELFKLKSTYTNTLIEQINKDTGRVHTTFNQAIVATGRLSSTNPNLQNIPTNTELGQTIRKAFIADEGSKLISFDYSQQELRLLAHLSNEQNLLHAFNNKIDIHALTAAKIFNKQDIEKVTKDERRVGKTVNFGIVYGISAFGLADRLKISNDAAQGFIDTFYKSYPRVKVFFEELKAEARNRGFIESIMGRRKSATALNSPNYQIRKAFEREVINFPLQGGAADIMKLAMIECNNVVQKRYSQNVRMVLQVHDELIFEVKNDDPKIVSEFIKEIRYTMINAVKLNVPVLVDATIGDNWGEL